MSSRNLSIINNNFNIFDKNEDKKSSKPKPKFKSIRYLKLNKIKKNILINEERIIMEKMNFLKLIKNVQKQKKLNNIIVNNKYNKQNDKNRLSRMKSLFIAKESSKDSDKIEESFKTLMKIENDKIEKDKKFTPNFCCCNKKKENIINIIFNPYLNQKSFIRKTRNKHFFFDNNIRVINNNMSNLFHNHILIKNL